MSKIEVKNVYKIFGDNPSKVLPMVQDGATKEEILEKTGCLLYTSPSPRDGLLSRMPSSA